MKLEFVYLSSGMHSWALCTLLVIFVFSFVCLTTRPWASTLFITVLNKQLSLSLTLNDRYTRCCCKRGLMVPWAKCDESTRGLVKLHGLNISDWTLKAAFCKTGAGGTAKAEFQNQLDMQFLSQRTHIPNLFALSLQYLILCLFVYDKSLCSVCPSVAPSYFPSLLIFTTYLSIVKHINRKLSVCLNTL